MFGVLPREMEEIRASQSKMLKREEKLEKRKPSATVTSTEGVIKKAKIEGMLLRKLRKILSQILRRGM